MEEESMGVAQAHTMYKRNCLYGIHTVCNDYVPRNAMCDTFSHWQVLLSEMILHFWEFTVLVTCGLQNVKVTNAIWFTI